MSNIIAGLVTFVLVIAATTAALAARLYTQWGLGDRVNIPFNCVITNVPGPQFPLFNSGAKLLAQYGMGPLFDGMGLIFPVLSYDGKIFVSVTSCREMLPDPEFFSDCLQESFDELKAATMVVPEVVPEAEPEADAG